MRRSLSATNIGTRKAVARQPYFAKRTLDVLITVLALPFMLPIMGIISILVAVDSPGPIFFIQDRVGKDGRSFRIYKFRTMYHGLDDSYFRAFVQAFVRGEEGDANTEKINKPFQNSQVTRIGRVLRKSSLDELPQLFNVLKGEMSLIGPRPNTPCEVSVYNEWHKRRLQVLPGITGLAQVKGRSSISFERIVKYDLEYIEKQSLWLDLKILFQTFLMVFLRKGAM